MFVEKNKIMYVGLECQSHSRQTNSN